MTRPFDSAGDLPHAPAASATLLGPGTLDERYEALSGGRRWDGVRPDVNLRLTVRATIGELTRVMPLPAHSAPRFSRAIGWVRWVIFTLLVLVVAPGAADLFEEIVCAAVGVECCDGDCCDGGARDGCPNSCQHCACCTHAPALPGTEDLRFEPSLSTRNSALGAMPATHAAEYRAPPFRPPLA